MSTESIKQDFESALVKHLSFKARLRSALYGNASPQDVLRDPDQCGLGKWIAERWHGDYARVPQMAELDELHRRIHLEANHLLDEFEAGRHELAREGFRASVQPTADDIVRLLQAAETSVRTSIPSLRQP